MLKDLFGFWLVVGENFVSIFINSSSTVACTAFPLFVNKKAAQKNYSKQLEISNKFLLNQPKK